MGEIVHTEVLNDKLKRKYQFIIPKDFIDNKIEKSLFEEQKSLIHPGFRKGKAPLSIVKTTKGETVTNNTIHQQITTSCEKLLEDNNWEVASTPKIVDVKFDNDLEYHAEFELAPDVPTIDLSSLTLKKESCETTEQDLDEYIEKISNETFDFEEAADDYQAQKDDSLDIEFVGKIDGKPFQGGSSKDFMVVIGAQEILPEIEDGLIGTHKGESKDIDAHFPADYPMKELASKHAVFSVKVKEISVKKPIKGKDDLIKYFNCKDYEDFENSSKKILQKHVNVMINALSKKDIFDHFDENYLFDVPESMIEIEMQKIAQQFPDEVIRRKEAEKRVRLGFLLIKIANKNTIEVEENDISSALFARAHGDIKNLQYMINLYKTDENAFLALKGEILENKVTAVIIETMATKPTITLKELEELFNKLEE